MVQRNKILALLVGVWVSAAVHAAGQEYALPELERLALDSSRSMMAAREQVSAARYAVQSAGAFPNPEVEYLTGTARSRAAGGNSGDARSVTLTQPIDLPWVRAARIGAAEAGLQSGEAGLRAFEADLLASVRQRYFEVLRRNAELRNAREDVSLMESVRSRIALRVETGEAPRFELIKADAEMLNAQKSLQAAGFRAEQARSHLRQSVGPGLPADYSLRGALREVPDVPPIETVRQALPADSPALARSRAEVSRAERQLEFERRQRWPSLAVKGGYDDDPDMRTSRVGVVLTVPLWDRRSGPVGEASAQLARSRHELAAQEFSLDQQLAVAYQQYEIAQAQVTALESGIVKQAENALRVAEAAYRFGERGFLEVLDAQRVFRAARAELIAARYELAAAWVEIERLRASPGGKTE
ncbi:TolC family protein [Dechloromonas sp. XY25]|uniref:TolC family protein n=1 Tax=Dechloromonas hankyongensis TaxID=2908002 RepID=A0ABS9JYY2_9RHOO|nr:TolC family protein [Dechloromonas hankyongensis]MCG2576124.1 TolC family protein [Dechloromonas hankyongensis]